MFSKHFVAGSRLSAALADIPDFGSVFRRLNPSVGRRRLSRQNSGSGKSFYRSKLILTVSNFFHTAAAELRYGRNGRVVGTTFIFSTSNRLARILNFAMVGVEISVVRDHDRRKQKDLPSSADVLTTIIPATVGFLSRGIESVRPIGDPVDGSHIAVIRRVADVFGT